MVREKALEIANGQMVPSTKEDGRMVSDGEKELSQALTDLNIRVNS